MDRLGGVAACFLAAGLAVGGWNLTHGTARAAQDCQVRTAWAGTESTMQQNGDLLERFPVTQPPRPRRARTVTPPSPVSVPAGGELWLFVGTIGDTPLDPETQLAVSYMPAGCP